MTIQQTIQKAIEGGWKPKQIKFKSKTITETTAHAFRMSFGDSFLLDPQFWQCLGKAMGWREFVCTECGGLYELVDGCKNNPSCIYSTAQEEWFYQWHSLIDHLAEGKSIESFFEKL